MPLTDAERAEVVRLLTAEGGGAVGRKFHDAAFPHHPSSLAEGSSDIVAAWRRPRKIAEKPRMFVEDVSYHDVEQGALGDCWFLSAAAAVAQHPDLIRQVIPEDQPLSGRDYHGIFVFRFWKMGQWVSVYIDDKLPVDEDNQLVYGRCTTENEFWLPLLEKAFAKFHGSYANIVGGFPSEALLSLTGFVVEEAYLATADVRTLFRIFTVELKNNSIIACATESTRRKGLMSDHAYTVTGVSSLRLGSRVVRLVRVRNPHACTEWQGPWSDSDPNWDEIGGKKLKELGYENKDDGQFWIKMSQFKKYFPDVYLAARVADFGDDYGTKSWQSYVASHYWKEGFNAGGGDISDEKFLTNPQYTLIVPETDDAVSSSDGEEDEEEEKEEEKDTSASQISDVVIELIQEQDRSKYEELYPIGITIFKVDECVRNLSPELLGDLQPHADSAEHVACSTAVTRLRLQPGTYIVVPSVSEPDISRKFLLRVYSRKPITFLT